VAETGEDLLTLPVGSAILTSHWRLFELDQVESPEYPEPKPEATGFSALDSDNLKEWHKDRRKWERENRRADAGKKYWIAPGELQPFPQEGLDHWFPVFILRQPMAKMTPEESKIEQ
jgi:hypothetical protein